MASRFERNFLPTELPDVRALCTEPVDIEDGYLTDPSNGTGRMVRLRNKGGELSISASRQTEEGMVFADEETGEQTFKGLWPLTEGTRLSKRRFPLLLDQPGLTGAGIDVYRENLEGLVIAAFRFEHGRQAEEMEIPEWLGDEAIEVTGVLRLQDPYLSVDGRQTFISFQATNGDMIDVPQHTIPAEILC